MIYFNAMYSYVKLPQGTIYNWMVSSGFQHIQVSSFKRLIPPASMIDASHVRVKKKNNTIHRRTWRCRRVFFSEPYQDVFILHMYIYIFVYSMYIMCIYIYTLLSIHVLMILKLFQIWWSAICLNSEFPKTSPNPKQVASFLISIHINPYLSWKISISNINDPYTYPHKSKCQSVSFLYPLVN